MRFFFFSILVWSGFIITFSCKKQVDSIKAPISLTALNLEGTKALQDGDYNTALMIAQEIFHLTLVNFGPHHSETIKSLNQVGLIQILLGRSLEARYIYSLVLHQSLANNEKNRSVLLASLNNMALTFKSQGRYIEALPLFEEAFNISREELGADHIHTFMTQNNLALTYILLNQNEKAELLLEQLQSILKNHEGLNSDLNYSRITLNNLAYIYLSTGRYKDAELLFKQAKRTVIDDNNQGIRKNPVIVSFFINGEDVPISCPWWGGGNGPFNPDPETGGDLAKCGSFGTIPIFGGWGDWWDDNGVGDGTCPSCPPCTFCGDGEPDPGDGDGENDFFDCDESDIDCQQLVVDLACRDCEIQETDEHFNCLEIYGNQSLALPFIHEPDPASNQKSNLSTIIINRFSRQDQSDDLLNCLENSLELLEICKNEVVQKYGLNCSN